MGWDLGKPCEDPPVFLSQPFHWLRCVCLAITWCLHTRSRLRSVFCSPSLGSGWRVSHRTCKHKPHSAGAPAVTPATANTSHVYSTMSSVNPSENNVIKTSWMKSCCLWALERVHVPISLLPVIYLPPFASVHAESFQEAAAVTIFLCRCVLCGVSPRGHLSEGWTWGMQGDETLSCRSAPALPASTDSHTSCGTKLI